jgi:hypothetical protein
MALDLAARWGDRVAPYIVTHRNDRPFEIPCAVGILFDDRSDLEAGYPGERERAYVIDSRGLVTLRAEPADASAVTAHVASALDG